MPGKTKTLTLGGGCFWCTEALFRRLRGVESVTPGYAGGAVANPTYAQVANGDTGHAEVIHVMYDPAVIDLETLLAVFFATHDPTTRNRQGADVGAAYRSVLFYNDEVERTAMQTYIDKLTHEKIFSDRIVTDLEPFTTFYPAENYHREYYEKNSDAAYCQFVIDPKIAKLRAKFADKLKNEDGIGQS